MDDPGASGKMKAGSMYAFREQIEPEGHILSPDGKAAVRKLDLDFLTPDYGVVKSHEQVAI